jgi:hypothetical protein
VADAVKRIREQNALRIPAKPLEMPSTATTTRTVAKPNPDEFSPKPNGDPNEAAPGAPLLPPPPTVVLLNPIPADSRADLEEWEMVRRSEVRFKEVILEAKAGVIKINGLVARTKDAWDLAEKLNRLPGVKQVILGNVAEK